MSILRMIMVGSSIVVALALVLGLATMTGGRSEAESDIPRLDHLLSYQIRAKPFEPIQVGLKDQFGVGVFEISRPVGLFTPTRMSLPEGTGSGVFSPDAHLKGYAIRRIDDQGRKVSNLLVTNQFGTFQVDIISPRLLLVPTAKIHLEAEPDQAERSRLDQALTSKLARNPLDLFKCYGISTRAMDDAAGMGPMPVQFGLRDQFQEEQFEIGRPVLLCNPTAKIHGDQSFGIKNSKARLMCFEAMPTDGEPVRKLAFTLNHMGPELLTTVQESHLCVSSRETHPVVQISSSALDGW